MPRELPFVPPVRRAGGVLIKAHELAHHAQRAALDANVRAWAKRRAAEEMAAQAALRDQAVRAGYQDGLCQAVGPLLAHLRDTDALHAECRERLRDEAQRLLSHCVADPGVLASLLDEWLRERTATTAQEALHVRLPRAMASHRGALGRVIEQAWSTPFSLELHDDARVLMVHGTDLLEIDAPRFVSEGAARLSRLTPAQHRRLVDSAAIAVAGVSAAAPVSLTLPTMNTPDIDT